MYSLPDGIKSLVLHSCCAPCSGDVIAKFVESGLRFHIYFYNPNIHPQEEYLLRKEENIRFAKKMKIPFVDADYDPDSWFSKVAGLGNEPERGARCSVCFDVRFERTAHYAHSHGFSWFTSCLGISRWKDFAQISRIGQMAAARYPKMSYWAVNFRKQGGSARMIERAKEEEFYQQEYCGCVYSLRDTNQHRLSSGKKTITRGIKFYSKNPN